MGDKLKHLGLSRYSLWGRSRVATWQGSVVEGDSCGLWALMWDLMWQTLAILSNKPFLT